MRNLINIVENKLLDVRTPSVEELADRYGVPKDQVDAQLKKGIEVELEHTTDRSVAQEIALDHISERLDYYELLAKVENDE